MVLLGKGFALMSIGRAQDAAMALEACRKLSATNPAQERFVADLLTQAQAAVHQRTKGGGGQQQEGDKLADEREEPSLALGRIAHVRAPVDENGWQSTGAREAGTGFEETVRAAFVRSVVMKEYVLLVMEGSPSAAATEKQHLVAQTLEQLRVRFHFIDTSHDPGPLPARASGRQCAFAHSCHARVDVQCVAARARARGAARGRLSPVCLVMRACLGFRV
jgi:hypothetical protein